MGVKTGCSRLHCYLYFIFVSFLGATCTERIDMDLGIMEPKPVVVGVFSNEEQWVQLSTSSDYLNGEARLISDAEVVVSDGHRDYTLKESPDEKGLYKYWQNIPINPNYTYRLSVQADFDGSGIRQQYSAVSEVAPSPMLDSLSIQVIKSFNDFFWFVHVNYQEVAELNSYLCRTYVNGMLDVGLRSYSIFDNRYTRSEYMLHKLISVLHERPFSDEKVQVGDTINVSFSGITKEYYDFLYGAMEEVDRRNPLFSGPPTNVKGNISNGALGMFTVYIASSISLVIADAE